MSSADRTKFTEMMSILFQSNGSWTVTGEAENMGENLQIDQYLERDWNPETIPMILKGIR